MPWILDTGKPKYLSSTYSSYTLVAWHSRPHETEAPRLATELRQKYNASFPLHSTKQIICLLIFLIHQIVSNNYLVLAAAQLMSMYPSKDSIGEIIYCLNKILNTPNTQVFFTIGLLVKVRNLLIAISNKNTASATEWIDTKRSIIHII